MFRVALVFALGALVGCGSQSSLMNLRDMSDENLISYYRETEGEIVATQKELEGTSKGGRVIPSAIHQDKLNDLRKRKYRIEGEFTRRGLALPATETPDGEGRY